MTKSPWTRFDRLLVPLAIAALVLLVAFIVVALTVSTNG